MTEICLRPWRLTDARDVSVMTDDEHLRHWSTMAADIDTWIQGEVAQHLGPTRAICVPENDRALGRVAVRLPEFASDAVRCEAVRESDQPAGELSYWLVPDARGRGLAYAAVQMMISTVLVSSGLRSVVLDIEADNVPSMRLAEGLGAERRSPARVKRDRLGIDRTLVVYVRPLDGA